MCVCGSTRGLEDQVGDFHHLALVLGFPLIIGDSDSGEQEEWGLVLGDLVLGDLENFGGKSIYSELID